MNISNGGLISKVNDKLYICDLENYSGTDIIVDNGFTVGKVRGLMWFSNTTQDKIYYSNQADNDYLYCYDISSLMEQCVMQKACYNIMLYNESLLYIDEINNYIYQLNLQSNNTQRLINEQVTSFIILNNNLFYSTHNSFKVFDINLRQARRISDAVPICINILDDKLVFANEVKDYVLSIFNLSNGELYQIDDIQTQSIITDNRYIYAVNDLDNLSITRVDMFAGEIIRICGEKASKLHIIEDYIYFQNLSTQNAWHKMPLTGGQIIRVKQY